MDEKVLFIGSYLSHKKGTIDIIEKITPLLKHEGFDIRLVSRRESRVLRLLHMFLEVLTTSRKTVVFEIFSGKSIIIPEIVSRVAVFRKMKIVYILRGGKLPEFEKKNKFLVKKTFKRADIIATPSRFLQNHFENAGFTVEYLPNAISIEKFPFVHRKEQKYRMLWVRAFVELYNPNLAIQTLSEVIKKFPEASLTMIGPDGGQKRNAIKLAEAFNLTNRIDFMGHVKNEKLSEYYHNHDIYLNTTKYESFGTAVMEAALSGIPIVSTKVGEIPFLWEDQDEILMVPDNSLDAMVESVLRIFENPKKADDMALKARSVSERFAWMNIKKYWINILS